MSQKRQAIYFKDKTSGKEPAKEWIDSMKDKMGKAKIFTRISRAENGNLGDHSSVGDGVFELRIDFGPGYRVYYALEGSDFIILLVAGDKSSQAKDISKSKEFWASHKNDKLN
jgi:putative addiction module killer protein